MRGGKVMRVGGRRRKEEGTGAEGKRGGWGCL